MSVFRGRFWSKLRSKSTQVGNLTLDQAAYSIMAQAQSGHGVDHWWIMEKLDLLRAHPSKKPWVFKTWSLKMSWKGCWISYMNFFFIRDGNIFRSEPLNFQGVKPGSGWNQPEISQFLTFSHHFFEHNIIFLGPILAIFWFPHNLWPSTSPDETIRRRVCLVRRDWMEFSGLPLGREIGEQQPGWGGDFCWNRYFCWFEGKKIINEERLVVWKIWSFSPILEMIQFWLIRFQLFESVKRTKKKSNYWFWRWCLLAAQCANLSLVGGWFCSWISWSHCQFGNHKFWCLSGNINANRWRTRSKTESYWRFSNEGGEA